MQYINHSFLLGSFRTFLFLTALLTPYVICLMVDMRNSLPFREFLFLLIFDLGDVEMEIDDMSSDNTKTACSAASKSKENHVSL